MSHPKRSLTSSSSPRSVRVRSRPLDELDETKIAIAVAMLARRLLAANAAGPIAEDRPHAGESVEEIAG